jgi:hypothetical protein
MSTTENNKLADLLIQGYSDYETAHMEKGPNIAAISDKPSKGAPVPKQRKKCLRVYKNKRTF